jgi:hypothetical protein
MRVDEVQGTKYELVILGLNRLEVEVEDVFLLAIN